MSDISPVLTAALSASPIVTYSVIALLTIIEGPVVFVVSGFLLKLGAVSLLPLFVSLTIGDLIGDAVWYWIGRRVLKGTLVRHGSYMGLTPEKLERLEATFMRHSSWLLFTSKATLGFGTSAGTVPMLMTAGAMKYPFRMYLLLNLLGEFVLLAIMLSIGYLFGTSYQTISADFKQVFLIGIGVLVVLGAIMLARLNKQKGQEQ